MKASHIVLLVGAWAITAAAQGPYNCPSSCNIRNGCFCASTSIPGGLTPDQTPMFVTLTLDDAIQPATYDAFMRIQNSATNPNGCRLPATYFMCNLYTDYWSAQRTYATGNEIAAHTITHTALATISDRQRIMSEIYDNWNAINILSGVPANEITGFRHPFLNYSRSTYDAIYELREYIKYESSVVLDPNTQGYWPHTLDYGMPVNPPNCNNCDEGSRWRYPGLWLIPMYALMTNSSPPAVWSAMDIVIDPAKSTTYEEAAANLRASFLMHYDKRLPFGLYQHVAQYIAWPKDVQDRKTELVIDFIRWTQTFRNVWYVTNQQLLQWIADPKPVDALGNLFTCGQNDDYKTEVCDGFDNDENGQIDESLVLSCTYGNQSFQSCFGCPDKFPAPFTRIENLSGNREIVPDAGCSPGTGPWDPIRKTCARSGAPAFTRVPRTTITATATVTAGGGSATDGAGGGGATVATTTKGSTSAAGSVIILETLLVAGFLAAVLSLIN